MTSRSIEGADTRVARILFIETWRINSGNDHHSFRRDARYWAVSLSFQSNSTGLSSLVCVSVLWLALCLAPDHVEDHKHECPRAYLNRNCCFADRVNCALQRETEALTWWQDDLDDCERKSKRHDLRIRPVPWTPIGERLRERRRGRMGTRSQILIAATQKAYGRQLVPSAPSTAPRPQERLYICAPPDNSTPSPRTRIGSERVFNPATLAGNNLKIVCQNQNFTSTGELRAVDCCRHYLASARVTT